MTIAVTSGLGVPGRAQLAADGRRIYAAKIQIAPTAGDLARSPAERRFVRTLAVVHEMGHVMGLDHDTRFCATMQPIYRIGSPAHCALPDETWRFRCRLLEPDDLTGARRLFGGRPRVRGPEFCALAAAPDAVQDAVAAPRPGGGTELSWRTPTGDDVVGIRVLRGDTCPTGPADPRAEEVAIVRAQRGTSQRIADAAGTPGACYAVMTLGEFNRPSTLVSATVPQQ